MILKSEGVPVINHAGGQESTFTIKASAHAFKILASNLYSKKIQAVVRELSCNAYDAHVEGDNPDPFVVHCPNYLEPWFSVQDWGVGISHEFMMDGYATAFHSTKNDSNKSIGGLGLGRLSAFAYSDSYSVVSVFNGVKRQYIVYLAESGFPTVNFAQETPTDERNGFTVHIPVKSSDFYEFSSEITKFFSQVTAPYKIIGSSVSITPPVVILEGNGWKKYSRGSGASYARMGLVKYPIQSSHSVASAGIVVDFPIGSLDITPSRESLSYSEATNALIKEKFDYIEAEITALMQDKIEEASNLWEATTVLYEVKRGDYSSLVTNSKFTYRKEPLWSTLPIENDEIVTNWSLFKRRRSFRLKGEAVARLEPGNLYCFDDGSKLARARIKQNVTEHVDLYVFSAETDLTRLRAAGVPIVSLGELPFTPTIRATRTKSAANSVMKWVGGKFQQFAGEMPPKSLYISCPFRQIKEHQYKVQRHKSDLETLGYCPEIFWVAPKFLPKITGGVEFYDFAELYISSAVEEKAASLKIEKVPSSLKQLFYALSSIGVAKTLVEPLEEIEDVPSDVIELLHRRGLEIKPSTKVADAMEEFLTKHPMLRVIDSYKINSNQDIIQDYVALHC